MLAGSNGAPRICALTYTEEGLASWSSSNYERKADSVFVRTYQALHLRGLHFFPVGREFYLFEGLGKNSQFPA
jgi:hypothetical protein